MGMTMNFYYNQSLHRTKRTLGSVKVQLKDKQSFHWRVDRGSLPESVRDSSTARRRGRGETSKPTWAWGPDLHTHGR
jgi:hypothetical protein